MEKTEERNLFECICRGDPRVCVLLGEQKPPAAGERVRRSRFTFILYAEGKYLLFHTLTRELLELPPPVAGFLAGGGLFPSSVLEAELPAMLYAHHYLVPENTEESRLYLELKDILVLKEELPKGITQYVILPTMACNARCVYCFEQGMVARKMSPETVEDTLRFILAHKPADRKSIHIHWFGGEPLCAADHIDRICDGLMEAGIEYTAEMTSNGSLFTDELVQRAAEKWKIGKVQITLDGMAEEYAKRKRYTDAMEDPFGTVIGNIHRLLSAGIGVTVRLNTDEKNLGEIFRVTDFLRDEFTKEEKKRLRVYAHSLFGQTADGLDGCPAGSGTDALEARVLEINDYICRQGLSPLDFGRTFMLKSHYCMVTAPECNVLIDADGQLFACDAMPEDMRYGDVRTGIDPEAWKRVAAPCPVREECGKCVFLPQCTEFDRCPNRTPYDNCWRQETRGLEWELRLAYAAWKEQRLNQRIEAEKRKEEENQEEAEKAERGSAKPEEAPDVSD